MGFFGFSHITALHRFAILLYCSDDAQTYRIVAHFDLKGGKRKLSHKTGVNCYLPFQKLQGLAGWDFRSVKFQLTFLVRIFIALLRLHSNSQDRRPLDCRRCTNNKNDHFSGKKLSIRPKNGFFDVFKH